MINTLPNYPQMWNDGSLWGARTSPTGHPPHSHVLPTLLASHQHHLPHQQFHQQEAAPSLASTRTGGNGESSLVDGDSPHHTNPAETSPFLSLKAPGNTFVDPANAAFYAGAFPQPFGDEQQSRSLAQQQQQQQQQQPQPPPPRRQHMMEDRVKNPCKVFIGGIGQGTVESTIRQHFSQYGCVIDCAIVTHRKSGKSRGFGFVTFSQEPEAQMAVRAKHKLDDVLVECREALPRDEARVAAPHDSLYMPTKIFVGGIPDTIQEDDFKLFFQRFGEVLDVSLAYDKSNHRPRGFGFVVFATPEAANMAVGCHSFHGKTVEAKHAVPRDVPRPPKARLNRRPQFDETSRIGTAWGQQFITDSNGLPLQISALPTLAGPTPLNDVPPLLMGQQPFPPPRMDMRDHNPYNVAKWNPNAALSTASSTFDMMSHTMAQAVAAGTADHFSAGLSAAAGNLSMGQSPTLDKLLLGGRSDSGSSFPLNASSASDNTTKDDDVSPNRVRAGMSGTSGVLGGPQATPIATDWIHNPFLFSAANPSSPMQALPLVPVTSPLLIPGQPCLGNFVSLDNLVTPNARPSTPQNGQQEDISGQRSWLQASATGTSPMFAFVNGALSAAGPPFQLTSQNSLRSLNYFLSASAVQPQQPNSNSGTDSPHGNNAASGSATAEGELTLEEKESPPGASHFINSSSMELNGSRFANMQNSGLPGVAGFMSTGQPNNASSFTMPSSLEAAMQLRMHQHQQAQQAQQQQQQQQMPRFGGSFYIQGAPAHFSQGSITSPVTSPVFAPQVVQSAPFTTASSNAARLMTSPVLATAAPPGSMLPIGVLHPPAYTPVSISPQRQENYEFNLPPPPLAQVTANEASNRY